MARVESGVDCVKITQGLDQQRGGNKQCHGQGNLGNHEHIAEPPASAAHARAAALFEFFRNLEIRGFERGRNAERDSRQQRY